jgi:hypothetical protein
VSSDLDKTFGSPEIAVAAERAQLTHMAEDEEEFVGELQGVLPEAHRFEFRISPTDEMIDGAVSSEISSSNLLGLFRHLAGQRCRARVQVRKIERPGKSPRVSYLLLSADVDG